ncbi:MAG: hypothetical protein ACREF6_18045 [Alphaproteobacteria bacterium]
MPGDSRSRCLPAGGPADIRPYGVARILRESRKPISAPEPALSSTIGAYLPSLLSSARSAYATAPGTPGLAKTLGEGAGAPPQNSPSATVSLSDAAMAYLGSTADPTAAEIPLASVAADARAWFDQQYRTLEIASAMLDGQVAVDLTGQSRATLSAVASDALGLFSADESKAAGIALQSRFDDAMAPHVVIARHTGNYVGLYQAASDYLDRAGTDERATPTWQDQKQAVVEGLAAAKASPGKAPDTGDNNDPVHALLGKTSDSGSIVSDGSTESVAAKARAMLDDQANKARDKGTELVFDPSRKTGQQVDFSKFDNRSLAAMVLNPDAAFSGAEARAAKAELDQRTRMDILGALTSGGGGAGSSLGLLQAYARMSDEEKSVLGVTEAVTNRVIQNYNTMISIQDAFADTGAPGGGGAPLGLSAYL